MCECFLATYQCVKIYSYLIYLIQNDFSKVLKILRKRKLHSNHTHVHNYLQSTLLRVINVILM